MLIWKLWVGLGSDKFNFYNDFNKLTKFGRQISCHKINDFWSIHLQNEYTTNYRYLPVFLYAYKLITMSQFKQRGKTFFSSYRYKIHSTTWKQHISRYALKKNQITLFSNEVRECPGHNSNTAKQSIRPRMLVSNENLSTVHYMKFLWDYICNQVPDTDSSGFTDSKYSYVNYHV